MLKADIHRLSPVDPPPTLSIDATSHTTVSRRLMNASNPAPQHSVGLLKNLASPAAETLRQRNCAGTTANVDAAATALDHNNNPPWILATGLGIFLAVA